MKLVLITKPTFFVEEDKIITTLFEEGLDNLHLYKPNSAPMYMERLLSLIPEDYYRKITVHDHFYLKSEYGLRGIHLERPDVALPEGYKGKFSRTCTNLESLKEAKKKASYVFLKYIFHSQSEPEANALFTDNELREASRRGLIDRHVYALGGMNTQTIPYARELGFGGVAVCGDIWNRFDIHNQQDFRDLIAHFVRLREAVG